MPRRLIAVLLSLLVAGTVLLAAGPVHASSTSKKDPDDSDTRLDVAKVRLETQGKRIVVTFTGHDAFSDTDLAPPTGFGIDFRRSKKIVRGTGVRFEGATLYGEICTYRGNRTTGSACTRLTATRLSDRSVQVVIPRAKIDRGARTLFWRASSFAALGTAGCTGGLCVDGVGKGTGYARWRL